MSITNSWFSNRIKVVARLPSFRKFNEIDSSLICGLLGTSLAREGSIVVVDATSHWVFTTGGGFCHVSFTEIVVHANTCLTTDNARAKELDAAALV